MITRKTKTVDVFVYANEEFPSFEEARSAAIGDFWARYGYSGMGVEGAAEVCRDYTDKLAKLLAAKPPAEHEKGGR